MLLTPRQHLAARQVHDAVANEGGSAAVMFGLVFAVLMIAAGAALDYARAARVSSFIGATLDAAALAAAKELSEGASQDHVETVARTYVAANLKGSDISGAALSSLEVIQDRQNKTLTVTAGADVETVFMRLAGIGTVPVSKSSIAAFKAKDIELSLVLDVTGSMSGSKIRDLQDASREAIDSLLGSAELSGSSVRIGLVPYAASVNAGDYADVASQGESRDRCVIERSGRHAFDDSAPGDGAFVSAYPASGTPRNDHYSCPRSTIVPLTADRQRLFDTIDGFSTSGWTAGHIGAAWGWYQVAPDWSRVWPAASRPAAYATPNLVKAVVLMTDGEFNTNYLNGQPNRTSDAQARDLCSAMKAKGVLVFSVGFKLAQRTAIRTMEHCASTDPEDPEGRLMFLAEDGDELSAAFRSVTEHLLKLRLAR